jgi:surfactin family lipopeptide synthetase A
MLEKNPHALAGQLRCDRPNADTLISLFEKQVHRTPDSLAATYQTQSLSYQQLNQRANQLAHHLIQRGAKPGILVGINTPRSLEMLVSVLAVQKTGAAYVPLDPAYPVNRLAFMLEDAACPLLIGLARDKPTFAFNGEFVALDELQNALAVEPIGAPACTYTPFDLAYVIYTSGSTGKPKGVEIEHRSAVNFVNALSEKFQTQANDVFLSVASLSFDMSVLDIFVPLSSGASVAIAPRDVTANPKLLLQELKNTNATMMQATPATWKMLLDCGLPECRTLSALNGGDALPQDLAQALLARLGHVWNLYGPTETTVYSTIAKYETGKPLIGHPIANTQIFILNGQEQPVPNGETGELHIAGDGLARGYRNRPELTREKFVPNPFSSSTAQRMYKTGDVARYTSNGELECLGRIDRQVKIRGHRIELGEVEAVVRQHPTVKDCVVIDVADSSGQKSLAAYCMAAQNPIEPRDLREHLLKQLPVFMVPAQVVAVSHFPLSPNGKIDRNALLALGAAQVHSSTAQTTAAPRNKLEVQVSEVWQKALRCGDIGIHDNFFDLGGHSLMAVSLTMSLEERFGQTIPLDALWAEGCTIAGMAALIESLMKGDAKHSRLVPLNFAGVHKPPLFVMHTMRGSVNEYQALASHLAADQPVIGIRSKGLYGDEVPEPDLKRFAQDCVQAIRQQQPQGPYLLAGFSVGGLIAYEVALLLNDAQEKIAFLGLFDTPAPGYQYKTSIMQWMQTKCAGVIRRAKRLLEPARYFLFGADTANKAGLNGSDPSRISKHAIGLFQSLSMAEAKYQVSRTCPVNIELFMAQTASHALPVTALGWEPFARNGITCHQLKAKTHEELMTPRHAQELAHLIKTRLPSCA